jgi:hypothetical protein
MISKYKEYEQTKHHLILDKETFTANIPTKKIVSVNLQAVVLLKQTKG